MTLKFYFREWPEEGEVVIAKVTRVMPYGAFASLEEFKDKEGFIHISEISPKWVKNIRDYVREGMYVVTKVIRIDKTKGHIDLSIKRVKKFERENKLEEWKREKRALKLLELLKESKNLDDKEVEKIAKSIYERYGCLYTPFEECVYKKRPFHEFLEKDIADALTEIALKSIEPRHVRVQGYFELTTRAPKGIEIIKKALSRVKEIRINEKEDVKIELFYDGAPKYKIFVYATDYKIAERIIKEAQEKVLSYIEKHGGIGSFHRVKG